MGPERRFRVNTVIPFLKSLRHGFFLPIQQIALIGDPDFIGVVRGRMIGLELKSDVGKLAELQRWKLKQIVRCGGIALVTYPENWVRVKNLLTRLNQGETDVDNEIL